MHTYIYKVVIKYTSNRPTLYNYVRFHKIYEKEITIYFLVGLYCKYYFRKTLWLLICIQISTYPTHSIIMRYGFLRVLRVLKP